MILSSISTLLVRIHCNETLFFCREVDFKTQDSLFNIMEPSPVLVVQQYFLLNPAFFYSELSSRVKSAGHRESGTTLQKV